MIRTTFWSYEVAFGRFSSTLSGAMTFKQCLAKAMADATYHSADHNNVTITLRENCGTCDGAGAINGKRRFSVKPCPDCRGNAIPSSVGPIPFKISDNVKLVYRDVA